MARIWAFLKVLQKLYSFLLLLLLGRWLSRSNVEIDIVFSFECQHVANEAVHLFCACTALLCAFIPPCYWYLSIFSLSLSHILCLSSFPLKVPTLWFEPTTLLLRRLKVIQLTNQTCSTDWSPLTTSWHKYGSLRIRSQSLKVISTPHLLFFAMVTLELGEPSQRMQED